MFALRKYTSDDKAVLDDSQFLKHLMDMNLSRLIFLRERAGSASRYPFAREGSDAPQLYEKEKG